MVDEGALLDFWLAHRERSAARGDPDFLPVYDDGDVRFGAAREETGLQPLDEDRGRRARRNRDQSGQNHRGRVEAARLGDIVDAEDGFGLQGDFRTHGKALGTEQLDDAVEGGAHDLYLERLLSHRYTGVGA